MKALIGVPRVSLILTSPILRSEHQTLGGRSKCNSPSLFSVAPRLLRLRTRSVLADQAHITDVGELFEFN